MTVTRRYNLVWEDMDDLQIEMSCVRKGGKWKMGDGKEYGLGLFEHFRKLQTCLWPDDDHNRWSDLILKTILENRITVVQGSRDSGKTRTMSKFALADYFCFPNETLTLMSSTDIRGLELRVWGDVKDLFDRARERWNYLPGNVVDAKHGVFTDTLGEDADVRDMRRGILCIPCIGSDGQWSGGLEKFVGIKQKRRRLLGDECFPAGTTVDTPSGSYPIESIQVGDLVYNAIGVGTVIAAKSSLAQKLLTISFSDGRKVTCTKNHELFTQQGWVMAENLTKNHYVYGTKNTLLLLRNKTGSEAHKILQQCLLHEVQDWTGACGEIQEDFVTETRGKSSMGKETCGIDKEQADGCENGRSRKNSEEANRDGLGSTSSRREWAWPDRTRKTLALHGAERGLQFLRKDENKTGEWNSDTLQDRCCNSTSEAGNRSRRDDAQQPNKESIGRKENQFLTGAWVDSVTVQEPGDNECVDGSGSTGGHRVYNLQINNHPSYSVNGFCVHNCQFMHINYINTLSNLDKGTFTGCFVGNPIGGNGKALDKMAEPVAGWDSLGEITKTCTWKNRLDGITVNLVGIDSPNFDVDRPKDYPYLIDQADVDRVLKRSGKDSGEFWSQIMGVRKLGVDTYRVLTRAMCLRYEAYKTCIWSGKETTRVLGIDAGYGGDPCEAILLEYGEEVTGQTVIKFNQTVTIPLLMSSKDSVEDQIAIFVKGLLPQLNVPPTNVFFEAGMRASLAISMARIVGNEVNAVNFGGSATDRPVSNDTFTFDEKTQTRRLKKASEHYSKYVTQAWFSIRQAVESYQVREMPEDVVSELSMREWRFTNGNRYELETKAECKERMGQSPNKADAAAVALEGAQRLGFIIERMKVDDNSAVQDQGWLDKAIKEERDKRSKYTLTYG